MEGISSALSSVFTQPQPLSSPLSSAFSRGFFAALSLIAAIGPQNAFILRLGLRPRAENDTRGRLAHHVLLAVVVCVVSDAVLVAAGVFGLGSLVRASPIFLSAARWGGAAFLVLYGLVALRRTLQSPSGTLTAAKTAERSLGGTLLAVLGFTFLNPHAYLDTVVLLGAIGAAAPRAGQPAFVVGVTCASALWFSALGYGARRLAPLFAKPIAWRWLDGATALLMFVLAASLAS